MGLSRTVFDKDGDFSRQSQKFSHPLVFCAPAEGGIAWNWVSSPGIKKKDDGATGPTKNFDDIFSRLDRMHERDKETDRTDGHRATAKTALTHNIAR